MLPIAFAVAVVSLALNGLVWQLRRSGASADIGAAGTSAPGIDARELSLALAVNSLAAATGSNLAGGVPALEISALAGLAFGLAQVSLIEFARCLSAGTPTRAITWATGFGPPLGALASAIAIT